MQLNGSRLRTFTVTMAIATALVGCEGGAYYDANAGRLVNGSAPARSTSSEAPVANDGAPAASRSAGEQPAYGPAQGASSTAQTAAPSPDARPRSYDSSASSFDPSSRTPPAPQLQADGTPMKPSIANVSPSSGAAEGGNEVLITGSGFASVQVMFGGDVARVTSQSSNAITVIAPDGVAGRPVSIVVTNRDGSYTVAGQAYTRTAASSVAANE
jgi:hypothetical protein